MKLGAASEKQTLLAGVLGVLALVACIYIYVQVSATFGGGSGAPATQPSEQATEPARPAENAAAGGSAGFGGRAAKTVGTVSNSLDPTLHMEAMLVSESVVYAGNGRNIFSPNSAPPPVAIPKALAAARLAEVHAPPPRPMGPPPPPPIDLKFFGYESAADGKRLAFLLHDDTVYTASAGDVVLRRYRVIAIDAKTIQVEDLQNNNKQVLPLLEN